MRRTKDPKRRAKTWARAHSPSHARITPIEARKAVADAYMAGYRSAIRARRSKLKTKGDDNG